MKLYTDQSLYTLSSNLEYAASYYTNNAHSIANDLITATKIKYAKIDTRLPGNELYDKTDEFKEVGELLSKASQLIDDAAMVLEEAPNLWDDYPTKKEYNALPENDFSSV